jgi:type II secretion system protein N
MEVLGISLGKRSQQLLRVGGYVLLALIAFVFALQMTFPYSRVKDRVSEVLSANYDVVIGEVERGWLPGKMILKNVSLKTRPTQANQVPTLFYIQRLSLDLGVFALLGKKAVVDIEATIASGTLTGSVSLSKERVKLDFHSDSLPGANLPFKELVSLPVIGKIALDVEFDLRLVRNKVDWTKAAGHLTLECPTGCTVGDGKTKLRPQVKRASEQEFVKDGIEFNKLVLDKLLVRLDIKKGKATVTKWDVPSKDGEVYLDFEATLEPLLNNSQVAGCLRFKASKELEKRDYATAVKLQTTGGPMGSDGLFHIKLQGTLREMKRLPRLCGPTVDGKPAGVEGGGERRPNLPVPSPDEVRPTAVQAQPPPPPQPPPQPAMPAPVPAAPPATEVAPAPVAPAPSVPTGNEAQPAAGSASPGSPQPPIGEGPVRDVVQ